MHYKNILCIALSLFSSMLLFGELPQKIVATDLSPQEQIQSMYLLSTEDIEFPFEEYFRFNMPSRHNSRSCKKFIKLFKKYIAENDRERIAQFIQYPFATHDQNNKILIWKNKEQFVQDWDKVFPDEFKKKILEEKLEAIFCNYRGIHIVGGHLWFKVDQTTSNMFWIHTINSPMNKTTPLKNNKPVIKENKKYKKTQELFKLIENVIYQNREPEKWNERNKNAQKIIQSGVDFSTFDEFGRTLLTAAVYNKENSEIVKLLIKAKAPINDADDNGHTALDEAANNAEDSMVKILIEAHADVNKNKPLICAINKNPRVSSGGSMTLYSDTYNIIRMLIIKGADVDQVDLNGNTAVDWAQYQFIHGFCEKDAVNLISKSSKIIIQ